MSKYLLLAGSVIIGLLVISGAYYLLYLNPQPLSLFRQTEEVVPTSDRSFSSTTDLPASASSAQNLPTITSPALLVSPTTSLESRIAKLEAEVVGLDKKITAVSKSTDQLSNQTSAKQTQYILLSPQATSGDRNWVNVDASQVSLSPDNLPGYTSMQLEVSAKLVESIGQVALRLYNLTDQLPVNGSTVSTNATTFAFLSSAGFKIPTGSKVYTLQIQSTLGNDATIQNARLRVNYN